MLSRRIHQLLHAQLPKTAYKTKENKTKTKMGTYNSILFASAVAELILRVIIQLHEQISLSNNQKNNLQSKNQTIPPKSTATTLEKN